MLRASDLGLGVLGFGIGAGHAVFRVQNSGLRLEGLGICFLAQGLGFKIDGFQFLFSAAEFGV